MDDLIVDFDTKDKGGVNIKYLSTTCVNKINNEFDILVCKISPSLSRWKDWSSSCHDGKINANTNKDKIPQTNEITNKTNV